MAARWKISETKARARLKQMDNGGTWPDGSEALCECGEALDRYELMREGERPKDVICCRRPACENSAEKTAALFRADLVRDPS